MRLTLLSIIALVALAMTLPACAGDNPAAVPPTSVAVTLPSDADTSCAKPGVVRPNCGTAPESAGDRGGTLQYAVWALLVVGLVTVFTVVFRSAKRTETAKRLEVGDRDWS